MDAEVVGSRGVSSHATCARHAGGAVRRVCYLGYMRQLMPRQQAHVRAVREAKGIKAAISGAKRILDR